MDKVTEEQVRAISVAKARLKAEMDVGRSMLPESVQEDCHWDGCPRAMDKNPKYRDLIKAVYYG